MNTPPIKALAFLLVLLASTLTAEAGSGRAAHRAADQPTRREMRTYIEQNVLPVVRQQRQKLEAQLTAPDKAQLATYRTQLQALRQRGQALRQSGQPAPAPVPQPPTADAPRPTLTEAQQQQLRELRAQSRSIMLSVSEMARKYESQIAQLMQEVQPQKEQWATDMRAIAAKNTTAEQQEKRAGFMGRRPYQQGPTSLLKPARFLLLDPTPTPATPGETRSPSLYPNPAVATSQLSYSVTKAGPVTVELLDGRGNILRTVAQEVKQDKGVHILPVNLSDLTAGTYYYKITTRTGSETKRFVKE